MAEPTEDDLAELNASLVPDLPVLFAVHNGMVNLTDETAQFVERSYLIPSELLPELYKLLEQYEIGEVNFLDIPMGGRPDGI